MINHNPQGDYSKIDITASVDCVGCNMQGRVIVHALEGSSNFSAKEKIDRKRKSGRQ